MNNLDYFRKQAKYLVKDWNTRKENPETDEDLEGEKYIYDGKYFDMYNIVHYFEVGDDFGLQKAQHIIAQMAGYKKWDDLQKADEDELSLARIRFLHCDPSDAGALETYLRTLNWNLTPISARFPILKDHLYNRRSNFLLSKQFVDEVLYGKEKEIALIRELQTFPNIANPETKVTCIHCNRTFPVKEATVIHEYDFGLFGEHDYIACKFHPECDGTLIDFVSAQNQEEYL